MSSDGIELVVTDLDGTLWDNKMDVHGTTFDALSKLEAAGIGVLVATGRRRRSAAHGLAHNGLDFPCVLLNGSLGVDDGEVFHERSFESTTARVVLETYAGFDLGPCVYLASDTPDVLVGDIVSTHPLHQAQLEPNWERTDLFTAVESQRVLGFSSLGHRDKQFVEEVAAALRTATPCTTVVAHDPGFEGYSLMVQPNNLSKWDGVVAYCQRTGLDYNRVFALGDAENDIDLLRGAAIGVAMGGAPEAVLAVANETTSASSVGGWAAAVDRLVLG